MVAFLKLGSTSQLPSVRCVPRNAVCSPTCVWERFGRLLLFLYKPGAASAHGRERAPPPGPVGVGKGGAPSRFCRVCPRGCGSSVYDFILRCRRPLTDTTERLRNRPPLPSPRLWDERSCGAGETAAPRAVLSSGDELHGPCAFLCHPNLPLEGFLLLARTPSRCVMLTSLGTSCHIPGDTFPALGVAGTEGAHRAGHGPSADSMETTLSFAQWSRGPKCWLRSGPWATCEGCSSLCFCPAQRL